MKKGKRHGNEEPEGEKLNVTEDRNKNYRSGFFQIFFQITHQIYT